MTLRALLNFLTNALARPFRATRTSNFTAEGMGTSQTIGPTPPAARSRTITWTGGAVVGPAKKNSLSGRGRTSPRSDGFGKTGS